VTILGPGDFLGEGCLAGQLICMATASAIAPTILLVIEKDEMIRVAAWGTRVLRPLHRVYAGAEHRNNRVEEDLIDQLFNSSEKRLARTLLLLARYGALGHAQKVLPKGVSQEMLAEMIGTTRSRVNFFMNKFRKLGFIQYNGGNSRQRFPSECCAVRLARLIQWTTLLLPSSGQRDAVTGADPRRRGQ
jgi:CRP/FNR family transcriptional regulator, cyclic AMP receptor protein